MRFFTPQRYLALQQHDDDSALDEAEKTWEDAVRLYGEYLHSIRSDLPRNVQRLLDDYHFHDAVVLSMGRNDDHFVIVLQLDVPPHEVLTITYSLAAEPEIHRDVFSAEFGTTSPFWLYEELEMEKEDDEPFFFHAILFSNGWELRLPFRQVELSTVRPMFPKSREEAITSTA